MLFSNKVELSSDTVVRLLAGLFSWNAFVRNRVMKPFKTFHHKELHFPCVGNCWIIWGWTKHWESSRVLWKSSWLLPKWRSNYLCQSVQAKGCTLCCSTWTVSFSCVANTFSIWFCYITNCFWVYSHCVNTLSIMSTISLEIAKLRLSIAWWL